MDLELDDSVALVTGSSRGIGKACARTLAAEGANVVCNGRGDDALAATVAELDDEPGDVVGVTADLTDPDAVSALVAETVETFGGLDHVVTNVSGPATRPFLDIDDAEWFDTYELLVLILVRPLWAAAPQLVAFFCWVVSLRFLLGVSRIEPAALSCRLALSFFWVSSGVSL